MALFVTGTILKELRKNLNLSQEELCYGVCAVSTLSKIENNVQSPSRTVFNALLSKLGVSLDDYSFPVTQADQQKKEIEDEIFARIDTFDYEYADLLERYKSEKDIDELEKQFLSFASAIYGKHHGTSSMETLQKLVETMQITHPAFSLQSLPDYKVFTLLEIRLLNSIALELMRQNEKIKAISLFSLLKDHFEKGFYSEKEKQKFYPALLCNMIGFLGRHSSFEEADLICDKAIEYCIKTNTLKKLDEFLYDKGWILTNLGKREDAAVYFERSFCLMEIMLAPDKAACMADNINQKFGYSFPVKMTVTDEMREQYLYR